MNPEDIFDYVMELAILPFFPTDPAARLAVARMIGKMARTEEQVRWLINVMTSGLYQKWEGPSELRAVFCMKYRPADGIESVSAVYPDGLDKQQLNPGRRIEIAAAPMRQIAGDVAGPVSDDPEMAALVEKIGKAKNMLCPTLEELGVRPDETELQALNRQIAEFKARSAAPVATDAQIEFLKAEQNRNRKESKPL